MTDFISKLAYFRSTYLPAIELMIDSTMEQYTTADSTLISMSKFHFSTGGKRLRALLPLLLADAMEMPVEPLIAFGAACEMLHNATLVHDDLQDGDTQRRGQETIWVKYGKAQAINLGDAMFFYTLLLSSQLDVSAALKERLTRLISQQILRVIDGQEREFSLKQQENPGDEDYFRMVEGKTSGLFALPLVGAAYLCDAPATLVDALEESARHLGVLFQIQDDILDLYADKGRAFRGSDIVEGKISALVVHFLQNGPTDDVDWLRKLLKQSLATITSDDIKRVAYLFKRHGSLDVAFKEITVRKDKAVQSRTYDNYPKIKQLIVEMADVFIAPIMHINSH